MFKKFKNYYVKNKHGDIDGCVDFAISCQDGETFRIHWLRDEKPQGNRFARITPSEKINANQLRIWLCIDYGFGWYMDFENFLEN